MSRPVALHLAALAGLLALHVACMAVYRMRAADRASGRSRRRVAALDHLRAYVADEGPAAYEPRGPPRRRSAPVPAAGAVVDGGGPGAA